MTAAERLFQLSGLASATAAEHLRAIAQTGLTTGARLAAHSGLLSATAAAHLLASRAAAGNYILFARRLSRR